MAQTPFSKAAGVDVCEQAQRSVGGDCAGTRCHLVLVGERSMIGNICGEGRVTLGRFFQGTCNVSVKELSARLRDASVGRLSDEVVREVVSIIANSPQDTAPFHLP